MDAYDVITSKPQDVHSLEKWADQCAQFAEHAKRMDEREYWLEQEKKLRNDIRRATKAR